MSWDSALATHAGLRRPRNEDACLARPEKRLYAVADGMGGHAAGDVASRMAVDILDRQIGAAPRPGTSAQRVADQLREAMERVNAEICARSATEPDKEGMGTTLTALIALESECVIAHIGDSRVYRVRDGQLVQLTTDHTWVQRQVAVGTLTPLQARAHPYSNVLTRVLGLPDVGAPDVVNAEARPGDLFLLCTDGLTSMVDDANLEAMLGEEAPVETLAARLIEAANLRGGLDNSTVVLLRRTAA